MRQPCSQRTTVKEYQRLWCPYCLLVENAHHCARLHQICVRPLIFRYSLNSSGLNAKLGDSSLDLGIQRIASDEDVARYGRSLGIVDGRTFFWVCAVWRVAAHLIAALVVHCRRGMQSQSSSAGSRDGGVALLCGQRGE